MITASALPRLSRCAASGALPQARSTSPAAERGTALHAYIAAVAVGTDCAAALAAVPEEYREDCEGLDLSWLEGGAWGAEVAYALDLATGDARELGRDLGRDYSGLLADEIAGTADLVGLTSDAVIVVDSKTGRSVDRARENLQLRMLAVCAARVHGRSRAVVAIAYVRDGRTYIDRADLDAMDLDDAAGEIADIVDRVDVVRPKVRNGATPDVSEGDWCRHCDAFAACPAKRDLALALGGTPPAELQLGMLTPQTAGVAWSRLVEAKQLLGKVEAAIKAAVAEYGEVPLPDGRVLREVETARESVDGATAYGVLLKLHGNEAAAQACEMSTSKAAIRRAVGSAKAEREALDAIRAAGGISTRTSRSVRETKGDGE